MVYPWIGGFMVREQLETQAAELGVEFDENVSDDDLSSKIAEKTTDTEDDPEYYKSELKKVISQRDKEKSEKRKLQNKMNELEAKMKDTPNSSEYETLKQSFEELKAFKEEQEKKQEEEEMKNKSEFERAEIAYKKQIKEMQEKFQSDFEKLQTQLQERESILKEKDLKIEQSRKIGLERDILEFAHKYKALNPQQVVKLLSPDFTYDDNLEKWVVLKKEKGKIVDEMDINDYVKSFLEDKSNENLVRATVNNDGSGHHENPSVKPTAGKTGSYDVNDAKLKKEAEMRSMKVEDYIDVLKIRDAKLEKIKANAAS
jgi:hypothetical protein